MVTKGTDLLSAAIKCGIMMSASCGGEGLCGKCRVIIKKGSIRTEGSRFISEKDRKAGYVLACQTVAEGDVEVDVPKTSIESREGIKHDSEEFTKGVLLKKESVFTGDPFVKKIYLELPAPTADDNESDLDRLTRSIGIYEKGLFVSTRLANVKHLSEVLRESDFKVTITLGYRDSEFEILSVESGDTSDSVFGMAFDIGTTTVVGQLIDLKKKEILGTRIAFNKQSVYGSDVIMRIIYASEPGGLDRLNQAVLDNINDITLDLVSACGVSLNDIHAFVCAGNMTMMHLLLKIDPSNIRKAPYIPTATSFSTMHAAEIGFDSNPKSLAAFIPGVSTYLGGDIVSGILACGLSENDDLSLLIDIGTNGEMVLGNREWMIGAAASAGPAFEGSGLECGMKAVSGAIQKIEINKGMEVKFQTIGNVKAKGICGSGYIDLLCQMLKTGLVTKDGKLNKDLKTDRLRRTDSGYEFIVAFKDQSSAGKDIVITNDDIENLKRAKGAVYSAVFSLLNKVGKNISEVKKIYIAGGFGSYLNIENSIFIGLLPDIDRTIYEFVGNSSLSGARISILSHEDFVKTGRICKNITYVDLSSETGYMDEYVAALFFPHTDFRRFPSVKL